MSQSLPVHTAEFTINLAQEAGAILMRYFGTKLNRTTKTSERDFATDADFASEEFILSAITKAFPNDAIIAEESGIHAKAGAEHTWIIDPLDGTYWFANNKKTFQVMIARARGDEIELAVIFNPAEDRLIAAQRGQGTMWNKTKLHIDTLPGIGDKPLGVNRHLTALFEKAGYTVMNSDITAALAGKLRSHITNQGKVWDHAPAYLALHEAGFTVTNLAGEPYTWNTEQRGFVATLPSEYATLFAVAQS